MSRHDHLHQRHEHVESRMRWKLHVRFGGRAGETHLSRDGQGAPVRPNQFDETADYRRLKLANVVDEYTREALAMEVDRSITADKLIDVIEGLVVTHGAPEHLRMDNGPELISWALRDWCRLAHTRTIYTEPGSPWENPFVESFNGRARDELLNIEEFATLTEARIVVEAWRMEYNTWRPHSSLGGLTPAEFKRRWVDQYQPACS